MGWELLSKGVTRLGLYFEKTKQNTLAAVWRMLLRGPKAEAN